MLKIQQLNPEIGQCDIDMEVNWAWRKMSGQLTLKKMTTTTILEIGYIHLPRSATTFYAPFIRIVYSASSMGIEGTSFR